ncbi:MAG: 4-hydroxy-3-methylbut-2-enyl diphosphate reductase [Candidatus Omnitrophica bacterium]|nr:4-hydroxy-3-methylbut-2-enyl diphosphate reductase [Candidatus Omnitrophota bacterium]
MQVEVAKDCGFCFGVKRAVEKTEQVLANSPKGTVHSVGHLIHNPPTIERLEQGGLNVVDDLSEIEGGGTALIRAHGLPPKSIQEAQDRGLELLDLTCPLVVREQRIIRELLKDRYEIVILGEPEHPEVKSLFGFSEGKAHIVRGPDDVDALKLLGRRVAFLSQSTQGMGQFVRTVDRLERTQKYLELRIFNTICFETIKMQKSTAELAREVDVMVVIGGRNSANTKELVELCRSHHVRSYHIETAAELNPSWFDGIERCGLTAGASTPDWAIREVREAIERVGSQVELKVK